MINQRDRVHNGAVAAGEKHHPLTEKKVQVTPWYCGGVGERCNLVRCDGDNYQLAGELRGAIVQDVLNRISGCHGAATKQ